MISASTNDIEFRSVTKRYGAVTAVSDINLAVPKGAFVALRPEAIRLSRDAAVGRSTLEGTVTHRIFLGSAAEYSIAIAGLGDLMVTAERQGQSENDLVAPGERVAITFDPGSAHIFPA